MATATGAQEPDENRPPQMTEARGNVTGQGVDTGEGVNAGVRATGEATGQGEPSARERMGFKVERVELVNNQIHVQVNWFVRISPARTMPLLSDVLVIEPKEDGSEISQSDIRHALAERATTYIFPTYFDPPIETNPEVAELSGMEGTLADLED